MKGGFWATGWDQGTPWGEGNRPEWGPQDLAAKALPVPGGLASGRPLILAQMAQPRFGLCDYRTQQLIPPTVST